MAGIHVYRVHDEASQTATIYALPAFLKQRAEMGSPVRLVIVDSIAFHYRVSPVVFVLFVSKPLSHIPYSCYLFCSVLQLALIIWQELDP